MAKPRVIDFETYAAEHYATEHHLAAKRARLRVAYDALVEVGSIVQPTTAFDAPCVHIPVYDRLRGAHVCHKCGEEL